MRKYLKLDLPLENKGIKIDTVLKMLESGINYRTIARKYNVPPEAISRYLDHMLNP